MSITVSLADASSIWRLRDAARTQSRLDLIEDAILAGPGTSQWDLLSDESFVNIETAEDERRDPIMRRRTGRWIAGRRTGFVGVDVLPRGGRP